MKNRKLSPVERQLVKMLILALQTIENLRARMKDGYCWVDKHSGYDSAGKNAVKIRETIKLMIEE